MTKKVINEFTSSSKQSVLPEPVATGSHNRPADEAEKGSNGETYEMTTKSEALSKLMSMASQLGKEEITDIFTQVASALGGSAARSADKSTGEISQLSLSPSAAPTNGNAYGPAGAFKSVAPGKGETSQIRLSPTSVVAKEDVEELFAGDNLSEELMEKATVVFEAAVNTRLISEIARIEEEAEFALFEQVEEIRTEVTENVSKYLDYAISEWVNQNAVAIDATLKTEIAEDFIDRLKSLFVENYIELPTDKVDVVAEMVERIENLESELNEQIEANIELRSELKEATIQEAFDSMTDGLTFNQSEKLKVLAENISYETVEDFTKKVGILKETYFKKSAANVLIEEATGYSDEELAPRVSGQMSHYVQAISQHVKK